MKKIYNLLAITIVAFVFPAISEAAILSITGAPGAIRTGDTFLVDVMLDTEGREVNAVAGAIAVPHELFEIAAIYERDTVVTLWVERPARGEAGEIFWSGIMPGGFSGVLAPARIGGGPGRLFSVELRAIGEGSGAFEFRNAKAFLHDGVGTEDTVRTAGATVAVRADAPAQTAPAIVDRTPPEEFMPVIARSGEVGRGKWFVAFAAHDKGTGVAGYGIHESLRRRDPARIATNEWTGAESPYVLRDQSRRSYVYVRAVDGALNERVAELAPMRRAYGWTDAALGLVILIVLILVPHAWWRKRYACGG